MKIRLTEGGAQALLSSVTPRTAGVLKRDTGVEAPITTTVTQTVYGGGGFNNTVPTAQVITQACVSSASLPVGSKHNFSFGFIYPLHSI